MHGDEVVFWLPGEAQDLAVEFFKDSRPSFSTAHHEFDPEATPPHDLRDGTVVDELVLLWVVLLAHQTLDVLLGATTDSVVAVAFLDHLGSSQIDCFPNVSYLLLGYLEPSGSNSVPKMHPVHPIGGPGARRVEAPDQPSHVHLLRVGLDSIVGLGVVPDDHLLIGSPGDQRLK